MKDTIDKLFDNLEGQFDTETPNLGHQQRFLDRLNSQNETVEVLPKRKFWKPYYSIAASVILLVAVFISFNSNATSTRDLASISPEMAQTQDFFTNAINSELEKLNSENNPEVQDLIVDALFQIKLLEEDYQKLALDLENSGDDKRVISAMISNFQSRIDLLENVQEQIEIVKQQNNYHHEKSGTL